MKRGEERVGYVMLGKRGKVMLEIYARNALKFGVLRIDEMKYFFINLCLLICLLYESFYMQICLL